MVEAQETERELARLKSAQLSANIGGILGTGADIGDFRLWTFTAPQNMVARDLREVVLQGRGMARADIPVAILGAVVDEGKKSPWSPRPTTRVCGAGCAPRRARGGCPRCQGGAAARPTWPRAAAPTRPGSRPSRRWRRMCGRLPEAHDLPPWGSAGHRSGDGAHRGGAMRPRRDLGYAAGADRPGPVTSPQSRRWRSSATLSRSSSDCR